jgi:methylated-DNA-[protein]-cysteine S-methyltransferase
VLYEADGFGVGELLIDGDVLLWHELPRAGLETVGEHPLATRLAAYFAGGAEDFTDVTLDLSWCTPFQHAVATALRAVPRGETVTYGELAALAGHPGASRAAGSFCAHNRFGIIVPCHRVVAADGLGGYGSLGADYKRRLLALEGATA